MAFRCSVSGVAQWHNGRWIVALNALEPDTRQRFSLAHELFHIINHTTKHWLHPDTRRFSSYATGERLADHFAACLLMPRRHVRALVSHGLHLDELAEAFDVSTKAMEIRLSHLRLGIRHTRRRARPATYYRQPASCSLWCEGAAA